jgi:hypothetical protein
VVTGVELPFGDRECTWWIDAAGVIGDSPLGEVDQLPGRYMLRGVADCHAHPAVVSSDGGPVALGVAEARMTLVEWARSGVLVVRDVGSPGGVTLEIGPEPGLPRLVAAGRFLAPAGQYFPDLLVEGVGAGDLIDAALGEVSRGAAWVKLIADFPPLPQRTAPEPTYPTELIAQMVVAVHSAGARVAAHSTIGTVGDLVDAGVDSIEHGVGLDFDALRRMAERETAWTPTLSAILGLLNDPGTSEDRRAQDRDALARFRELLPAAVRLGVPVLAGTDVVGTIAGEVRLLGEFGLSPQDALAAASIWPRQFLGLDAPSPDIVTYEHDPRDDPAILSSPSAVVSGGLRLR